ncbi:MAG TPA: STAS domain-containing protein [Miltoncostaeaceae bacterium]|jgi:anti-sigma B factor antagonist|nr:STAS domain-containing protein [Miltoncostaeaceae bacterium]
MITKQWGGEAFTVAVDVGDGTARLTLGGELDLAGGERFREALEAALAARHRDVVIECGELTYIDSTGISLICQARLGLQDGGTLVLRGAQPGTQRAIELCGLGDWLDE